jgi:DNA-binding transcriptional MerR regulator
MSEAISGKCIDVSAEGTQDGSRGMRHEMNNCDPPEFFLGADDSPDNSSGPAENEPVYTIGELAKAFDISLRTLRFYESRGLLSPGRQGRRRLYKRTDAARLAVILKARKLGFTLSEIRQMAADEASQQTLKLSREKCLQQIGLFERKREQTEEALAELRRIYTPLSSRMVQVKPADQA